MLKKLLKKSVKLYDAWFYIELLNFYCPTLDINKVEHIMMRMYNQFSTTSMGKSANPFYNKLKQMGFGKVKMGFAIQATFKDTNDGVHVIVLSDVSFSSKLVNWFRKVIQKKKIGINASAIHVDGESIIHKTGIFLKPKFLMEV